MSDENEEGNCFWSFGFGSNMDVNFVREQKGVEILGKKAK